MTVRDPDRDHRNRHSQRIRLYDLDEAGTKRERFEEKCPYRTEFQRDRDRILHATLFAA